MFEHESVSCANVHLYMINTSCPLRFGGQVIGRRRVIQIYLQVLLIIVSCVYKTNGDLSLFAVLQEMPFRSSATSVRR